MIIDCHTHLNCYDASEASTLAQRHALLRKEMDAHGIDHAVVLTSYDVTPERPSPGEVLAQVEDDPRISVVAGISYPHLGAEQVRYLRSLLEGGRIRGLKLYPGYQPFMLNERRLHPVYEMAGEYGVPVMVHTGDTFSSRGRVRYTQPIHLDDVAVDFRETTFVMCHLGNPWFIDAMEVVYKNENMVADISGLTVGAFEPRYERFVRARVNDALAFINEPHKLMFGSDWPISDLGSYLKFVDDLETNEAEKEGILWRNAARVFKIPVPEAVA